MLYDCCIWWKMEKISRKNKDYFATFVNSFWRIISGPILLLCIPYFLTSLEQGYWYTFTGLSALSIFADLGFTMIVLQFTAHEFAYLRFEDGRELSGDIEHLWRLASFFRFVISWLKKVLCIFFPVMLVGGYYFLSLKHDNIDWQFAWMLYSLASAGSFFNASILSFFEGCNSVGLLQSIRFRMSVVNISVTFICLYIGLNIYALGIALLTSILISGGYILYYFRKVIIQLWMISAKRCYEWWPEFSALIWRYGISWCSGYFIFQIFTPLAFYFHGADFSGKVGISIAMWTAGYSIANSWMTVIMPHINMLVAERKWQELDTIFNRNLHKMVFTMIVGGGVYFILYLFLNDKISFFYRVLPNCAMIMLYISWIIQSWISGVAYYLRAHKREPLMKISIVSAIWVAITTYLCARFLPPEYMFAGFLSQYWVVIVVYKILKKQQKEHLEAQA